MDTLITIGQLLLGLSILVALHEFGHFLPAKLFGMRVEKFFLFFDAPYALFKRKVGETVYGIGSLPFGGYVKISGMIDESMDKEQKERLRKPPEPWEFRAKPVWQRLVVMLGGFTVNAILGFLIYALVMFTWGREYIALDKLPYGIDASALMERQGFRDGDRIVEMPGFHPRTVGDVSIAMLIDDARHVVVERADGRHDILLPATIHDSIMESGDKLQLGADAVLQVVYFGNGRQESWRGAARFEIGDTESKPAAGAAPAEVKQLPQMLVRQLVKTPTADASGRIGAVRMRSIAPPDAAQKLEDNYKGLREQMPAADRTPELYLLAGLFELKEYDRVEALLKRWSDAGASDADFVAMREHYTAAVRDARAK